MHSNHPQVEEAGDLNEIRISLLDVPDLLLQPKEDIVPSPTLIVSEVVV